jgi:hypothetical protein
LFAVESAVLTLVKVFLSCVPTDVTAAMMTTEIRAAIRPYSTAVAPASSRTKDARTVCRALNFEFSDFIDGPFYGS